MTAPPPASSTAIEPALAVRLVLGVARLGEADLAGWWTSQGMNRAVRFALAGFRRTGPVVGAELALLSAIRRHHQLLPRANAVHLFSAHLPYCGWTSSHLAELKSAEPNGLIDELQSWTSAREAAERLIAWADNVAAAPSRLTVASIDDLRYPVHSAGLLRHFVEGYAALPDPFSVPYVDLAS